MPSAPRRAGGSSSGPWTTFRDEEAFRGDETFGDDEAFRDGDPGTVHLVVAVECWGPAHTGTTGTAWWLAHGLSIRGHRVEVVAAGRTDDHDTGVRVRTLAASWPSDDVRLLASARAGAAARAMPAVQRDILERLGATTDASSVDFRGADALVAVGLRSPHVRALTARAQGRIATALQVTVEDMVLVDMPLVRLAVRGHALVTSLAHQATELSARIGRPVEVVPPGAGPPAPGPVGPPAPGFPVRAAHGHDVAVVVGEVADHDRDLHLDAACRRAGLSVVRIPPPALGARRVDAEVARSATVVLTGDDAGDLPAVVLRHGRPLVVTPESSGAAEVAESGAGWVVDGRRSLAEALHAAAGPEGTRRGALGAEFVTSRRSWDQLAPRYERLVDGGSLTHASAVPRPGSR